LGWAAASFRRALSCWRDPPPADLPHAPEFAGEVALLLEQRQQAILDLTDIELQLGLHDRILPALHTRVVAGPSCERSWEQFVRALSQSGRRTEALAACGRAWEALNDAHGPIAGQEALQTLYGIVEGRPPGGLHTDWVLSPQVPHGRTPAQAQGASS
jgi:hypothetical protein